MFLTKNADIQISRDRDNAGSIHSKIVECFMFIHVLKKPVYSSFFLLVFVCNVK
jgi:hypothetical protein